MAADRPRQRGTSLGASCGYVAQQVRRGFGWLDWGRFHWRDAALGPGVRAALGVVAPLAIGTAVGRVEYGTYAALGALPAGFVTFSGVTSGQPDADRILLTTTDALVDAVNSTTDILRRYLNGGEKQGSARA